MSLSCIQRTSQRDPETDLELRMEGVTSDETKLINLELEKCAEWNWVEESQIMDWIRSGERTMFLPIIHWYQSKGK